MSEESSPDLVQHPGEGSIIGVKKPVGISSFGVVRRIRSACGIKRVGHAGTLDPFAEGVLVVGIGRSATKQLGDICDKDKEYIADVRVGMATDTGDLTGNVIEKSSVENFTYDNIIEVLAKFNGEIEQIPPSFSAIKIDGQRLYKLARNGIIIEREPRKVTIFQLNLIGLLETGFQIKVVCSKGTYIRTLAEDIAKALGGVAHLTRLIRTRVGEYSIVDAWDFDSLVASLNEGRR